VTNKLSGNVREAVLLLTPFLSTVIFYILVTNFWPFNVAAQYWLKMFSSLKSEEHICENWCLCLLLNYWQFYVCFCHSREGDAKCNWLISILTRRVWRCLWHQSYDEAWACMEEVMAAEERFCFVLAELYSCHSFSDMTKSVKFTFCRLGCQVLTTYTEARSSQPVAYSMLDMHHQSFNVSFSANLALHV